jgi:cell division protease FtsH
VVHSPDAKGRAAILKVHTRDKPLAPDVDLEKIAPGTPGLVGADLREPGERGGAARGAEAR